LFFQASRRALLEKMKSLTNDEQSDKDKAALESAINFTEIQVKQLEYWSDGKLSHKTLTRPSGPDPSLEGHDSEFNDDRKGKGKS
jgi:hypothetical protein